MTGIVLMGGKSKRMGSDKAFLSWHGQTLYSLAAEKLRKYCTSIYLSINDHQEPYHHFEYSCIKDAFENEGPMGGIITCHRILHDSLFILACDMPFVSDEEMVFLMDHHASKSGCTMFYNENRGHFEPLLSIWDVHSLEMLDVYFSSGGRSLQQFLIKNDIEKLPVSEVNPFRNINNEDDWTLALK
jgi:molybdopterin-guanine dinucleotide biosynthesis protein A